MASGRTFWIAALLALAVAVLYGRTGGYPVLMEDDKIIITDNVRLRQGLTPENLRWAFTTRYASNWFPLTWLSYLATYHLFGHSPAALHLGNVLLHALSAAGLFILLARLTGSRWRSALVAALFAVHPQNVEGVAYINERSTVLNAFLGILALLAYERHARRPSWRLLILVAALTAGAMASKPAWVTLPFALLLLDFWPLARWRAAPPARLLLEKAPLFALAAAASALTFLAQRHGGMVRSTSQFPLGIRLENAALSYARYLGKMLWPAGLGSYPHPGFSITAAQASGAALLLAAISAAAVLGWRRRPYLLTGWLWYLGTMVPMAGIVQVGWQGMADRYAYLPVIGAFLACSWVLGELAGRSRPRRLAAAAACSAAVAGLAAASWLHIGHWRDHLSLQRHLVAVSPGDWTSQTSFGMELLRRGMIDEGVGHLEAAVRLKPDGPIARTYLGIVLSDLGRTAEALAHLEAAARAGSKLPDTYRRLGRLSAERGWPGDARDAFRSAVLLDPGSGEAHHGLGLALAQLGSREEALRHLRRAAALQPLRAEPLVDAGWMEEQLGRRDEARATYREALQRDPLNARARARLGAMTAREKGTNR